MEIKFANDDLTRIYTDEAHKMSIAALLNEVPHPGEFIRDELEARGWVQRDLAYILDVPERAVNMILAGKQEISPDMAQSLSKAFGISAEYFLNLQKTYERSHSL